MKLKPDQVRRGQKVIGIAPKPHITQVGDVMAKAEDHKFWGVITEIEKEGDRELVKVVLTKPSIEQRMFDVTDEICFADELEFDPDYNNRTRAHMHREVIDYCEKCSNHFSKVGVIRRLELPGGAGSFLCKNDWRREMSYREARNRDLGIGCKFPIVEWEE